MKLVMPDVGQEELEKIQEVFASYILTNGEMLRNFEQAIKEYICIDFAMATSTGTSALHLAVIASGITEGDEVIIPAMAFPSVVNVLLHVKAVPVLIDININTLNIDYREIKKKITPKTKAIIAVDLFGMPVEIDKINAIAGRYGLVVIEEASYAFGSRYHSCLCTSQADIGVFSFNERRVITAGEGGMVVTNNPEIAEKVALLRNHGMQKEGKDIEARFRDVGYNYRMSEIHAAIGLAQFEKKEKLFSVRRKLAHEYTRIIEELPNVTPHREPLGMEQNYSNYVIKMDVHMNVERIKSRLAERSIPTTIGTYCLNRLPLYNFEGHYPVAEYAYKYGISLPINSLMTNDDVYYVCEMLERFVYS